MKYEDHKLLAILLETLRVECIDNNRKIKFKKDQAKSIYTRADKAISETKNILDELSYKELNLDNSIYYGALK